MSTEPQKSEKPKKYLGVHFECCNVYRRVYINKDGNAYEGSCPMCYRTMKVIIGPDGSTSRFFRAQ